MQPDPINRPFTLPCGAFLKNRLVKSAMTERMSNRKFEPTEAHHYLYEKWSQTGAGLLITGNVMIDKTHLESAGNILFSDEKMIPKLRRWAQAATKNDNHCWVQISHAGRQTNKFNTLRPMAPSIVPLRKIGLFGRPMAMSEQDIQAVIKGFVKAASISRDAHFTGVQIHAAHGYLLSEFLSPNTNRRTDLWGGDIEHRSRLLLTIVREMRKVVGFDYPISVKINSSDFQKGGFTQQESLAVIKLLDKEKIDLLEISGGTYEQVAFFLLNESRKEKSSTRQREAYFIDFAQQVRKISQLPLLVTGGFRSLNFCNEALRNGELDLIGMARPFITDCENISRFMKGEIHQLENLVIRSGIDQLEDAAEGGYYARQLIRLSRGKKVNLSMNPIWSSINLVLHEMGKALAKKLYQ